MSAANQRWPSGAEVLCMEAGMRCPTGVTFDGESGRLLVCDGQNGRLLSVDPHDPTTCIEPTILATELRWPYSSCIMGGSLFVLEESGHCVRVLPTLTIVCGKAEQAMGSDLCSLKRPYGICAAGYGTLLIADKDNSRILRWKLGDPSGVHLAGGVRGYELDQLNLPSDVCVHPLTGSVVVCDMQNHRIMEYSSDGSLPRVRAGRGPFDSGDSSYQLCQPISICFDQQGTLYVADGGNDRVQRFSEGSSEGTTIAAGLNQIHGICIDSREPYIYVAESGSNSILRIPLPN